MTKCSQKSILVVLGSKEAISSILICLLERKVPLVAEIKYV